jgi:hypothetical protein
VPKGHDYHLVPRWRQTPENPWLTLNLETAQQRQRLGLIGLEALAAGLKTRDIVIWAGDLDSDGKIDLITRAGDNPGMSSLHLWLSTQAATGDMVGLAASLQSWVDVDEAEGC